MARIRGLVVGGLVVGVIGILGGAPPSATVRLGGDVPFTRIVVDANKPDGPDSKTVGDIDGDGRPDIIVASSTGGGMYWYRFPSWSKHAIRTSGGWTTDMQAGDIDGDGDLDVIAPHGGGLVWYRNPRPGGDPAVAVWAEFLIGVDGANNHDVEVGDINLDGRLDVVSRPLGGGATNVWIQSNPTTWIRVVAGADAGEGTALGDLDGDGDLDIAHNGFWLENPLPGGNLFASWPSHSIDSNWPNDVGVLIADVNGDGRADVVLAPSESSGRLSWYEATDPKNGPWVEHLIDGSVSYFHTFKAADMDGDGRLDLVTAEMHQSSDPDEVSVYFNQGGGLSWYQQVFATTGSHNLRIADIDGDGDVDVVGVNWHESAADGAVVTLWRNDRSALPGIFTGGLYVALANLDGVGGAEIITGAGAGGGPHVRAFAGDGSEAGVSFMAYASAFAGGVRVAGCDVDADPDGRDEIVTAPGAGGGPHVRVWKVVGTPPVVVELLGVMAFDPAFAGGVWVACGDLDGDPDGRAELVTGAGPGGGPHVRVWKVVGAGASLSAMELFGFYAYDPAFTGGVRVAVGDIDASGDGRAEIVTGPGPGGGPHIRVWRLNPFAELAGFFAYDPTFRGGVFVAAADLHPAPGAEIVIGADAGGGPHVRALSLSVGDVASFFAYPTAFAGGVRVAAGGLDGGPGIVTGVGPGGGPHVRAFDAGGSPLPTSFFAY